MLVINAGFVEAVSVPFRGNGTSTVREAIEEERAYSFSPLSGKWYFNGPKGSDVEQLADAVFQSPFGEMVLQLLGLVYFCSI